MKSKQFLITVVLFLFIQPLSALEKKGPVPGQFIVKLLSEGKKESDIIQIVLEKYDIEADSFQRYMDDFTMMLGQYNLIEKEEV